MLKCSANETKYFSECLTALKMSLCQYENLAKFFLILNFYVMNLKCKSFC